MMVKTPIRLAFTDFVDLQTRVVLLPRIEEEGRGAIVASYSPSFCNDDDDTTTRSNEISNQNTNPETKTTKDDNACDEKENSDLEATESMEEVDLETEENESEAPFQEEAGEVPELCDSEHTEEQTFKESNPQDEAVNSHDDENLDNPSKDEDSKQLESSSVWKEEDIVGTILVGIENDSIQSEEDWREKDFTEILAFIRESPTPIILLLEPAMERGPQQDLKKPVDKEAVDDEDTSTESSASDCEDNPAKPEAKPDASTPNNNNLFGGRLSSWSSQLRATSAHLAAEAASVSASLAERANKMHQHPVEQAAAAPPEPPKQAPPCRLFLQLSSGKFAQVDEESSSSSGSPSSVSSQQVSTSSVLLIRLSATAPCPSKTHSFQWYRSCGGVPPESEDKSRCSSNASRRSSCGSSSSKQDVESIQSSDSDVEWNILKGATFAAYQPSATDVGHRLRCVITITEDNIETIDHADDDDSQCSTHERTEICELPQRVSADMSLFNAARQNLGHGAKFSNLKGCGNAEGRTFLVQIEISRTEDRKMTSALKLFQVSGSTAELVHEGVESLLNASAISNPSQPKRFALVFPSDSLPEAASMVSALSTDGRFELEAPNRITRETLLLALGIANYKGRPADLNITTVLYPSVLDDSLKDDSIDSSLNEISISGSFVSAISKDGSQSSPGKDPPGSPTGSISSSGNYDCNDRMQQLEQELHVDLKNMRKKLARKDKVVSDLQRQLTISDSQLLKKELDLEKCRKEHEKTTTSLKLAERRIETQKGDYKRLKSDHEKRVSSLESRIEGQAEKMAEMEKMIRSLQNEKAVLTAAVDARDSKLEKMEDLQKSNEALKAEAAKGDALRIELNQMTKRCKDFSEDLDNALKREIEVKKELRNTRDTVDTLNARVEEEQKKATACQSQFGNLRTDAQKFKSERNSFKQKADGLAKEIARICRNGLSISDVERIVQDEESRRTEVSLLRAQKRKAVEEMELYRTAFDHSVAAQSRSGIDTEAVRALEQKAELERLVAELTEYLNAKEMQLETVKQVNQSLQEELQEMALANKKRNSK